MSNLSAIFDQAHLGATLAAALDNYMGARGGTSVFAALYLESMIIYSANTSASIATIENIVK